VLVNDEITIYNLASALELLTTFTILPLVPAVPDNEY
jgi:hypothetical protein